MVANVAERRVGSGTHVGAMTGAAVAPLTGAGDGKRGDCEANMGEQCETTWGLGFKPRGGMLGDASEAGRAGGDAPGNAGGGADKHGDEATARIITI